MLFLAVGFRADNRNSFINLSLSNFAVTSGFIALKIGY